ncbi:hypothetical protein [Kordia sp.]|uniref:hypothetical protein n=1 Tax=Kordia sp. TaxID=1965332 RepID=UPI003D2E3B75
MKKNTLALIALFCIVNFAIAEEIKLIDPPGMFQEVDCTEMAFNLYDELIYQEVDLETASETAFMTLIECESKN